MFGHLFLMLRFSWNIIRAFDRTTNADDFRTVQWNSSRPCFHLKIDFLNSCIDLILYWKSRNYRNVVLLNLKVFWCAWWPIFFPFILFIFCCCCHKRQYYSKFISKAQYFKKQNAVVMRFEIVSYKKLAVQHQFSPPQYCCLFFKLSKNTNVVVLRLLIFFSSCGHQCPCD